MKDPHHRDSETQRRASGVRRAPQRGGAAGLGMMREPHWAVMRLVHHLEPATLVGLQGRPTCRTLSRAIALCGAVRLPAEARRARAGALRSNGFLCASEPPWCFLLRVLLILRVFVVAFFLSIRRHDVR